MLGALTLPSVSTGFSSDSKSMVPVSIQGMADKVEMSLNVHSMEDILMDVRDAIHNTSLAALKSFTMLQETMVTGFTMLSNSLMNIGNIASKDLELEETQTNIDIENEEDEDRNESLAGPTGGGLFTDKFKGGITKTLNRIKDLSFIESLIALGAGLLLLSVNFDKITGFIGDTVKFFDEKVIPRAKLFYKDMKEFFNNLFDGLFGDEGFFTIIFSGIGDIKDAIENKDGAALLKATKDLLIKGTLSAISVIGTTVLGIIKAALGIVDPDMDRSGIDELINLFKQMPNTVAQQLADQEKEFLKVTKEDGFFAGQIVAFRQTYDTLIGLSLNGLSNILGIALKPFFGKEWSDQMQKNDYRFANIKSVLGDTMDNIVDSLERMNNGIAIYLNKQIDSINKFTSFFGFEIPKMPVRSIEGQNVYVNEAGETVPMYKEMEIGKDIGVFAEKEQKSIEEVMKDQILGDNFSIVNGKKIYFDPKDDPNYFDNVMEAFENKDNNMSEKTKEIKELSSQVFEDIESENNFMFADNKTITTTTDASQTNIVTTQRVDSNEASANALLDYFKK
jgi:hypothetical protein